MNLKFKALGLAALVGVSMLGMTACSNEDYMKKYEDYLNYSMGEWEVADASVSVKDNKKFTVWNVKFKNAYGEEVRYKFSNQSDANSDDAFGSTVASIAVDLVQDELNAKVFEKILQPDEVGHAAYKKSASGFSAAPAVYDLECFQDASYTFKYTKSLISDKDGMKLSELTASDYFVDKPRYVYVYAITTSDDEAVQAKYEKQVEKLVEEIRAFAGEKCNVIGILNYAEKGDTMTQVYSKAYIQGDEIIFDETLEENEDLTHAKNYSNKLKEYYDIK